ncbi:hypothetical protein QE152_g33231 [Popillia japonica]|uniref:Uncharacterized protein n=1 Tax=Popillia japonica TaxID=7064 RepID=A0AAW1IXE8_POPJA
MGNNWERTQSTVNQWNNSNSSKTKVMTINAPKNQQDIMCGDDTLERVSTITYLVSKISDDGKVDVEILNRSKKATQLFYQLINTILGKKEVGIARKSRIYNTVVVPTIIYGSETWPMTRKLESRITAAEMK